jgi:hypothetical protein
MLSKTKPALERVRYFARQLMTAEDMRAEQDYFLERMRRHNRLFHGWGILCGLEVEPAATADKPWQVVVCPGDACCPTGDEVHVGAPTWFDLANASHTEDDDCVPCPCPPEPPMGSRPSVEGVYYLAIRYLVRATRPIRTSPAHCGCAENSCETSRFRDDFELALLTELPVPYDEKSVAEESAWMEDLKYSLTRQNNLFGLPTRPCGSASVGPWVILASMKGDLSIPPPGDASTTLNDKLKATLQAGNEWDKRRPLPRAQDVLGFRLST